MGLGCDTARLDHATARSGVRCVSLFGDEEVDRKPLVDVLQFGLT
jgi:hypothetical protein